MTPPPGQSATALCPHCGYNMRTVASDLCPNCGRRLARVDGMLVPSVQWTALLRSLALRAAIALPLAFGLVCVSVWASRITGSAKIQASPGIFFGVLLGWGFAFGLAERSRRVTFMVHAMVFIVIAAIMCGAVAGVMATLPDLAAGANQKRFWFATGALGGTTIMCAMMCLAYESKSTILR